MLLLSALPTAGAGGAGAGAVAGPLFWVWQASAFLAPPLPLLTFCLCCCCCCCRCCCRCCCCCFFLAAAGDVCLLAARSSCVVVAPAAAAVATAPSAFSQDLQCPRPGRKVSATLGPRLGGFTTPPAGSAPSIKSLRTGNITSVSSGAAASADTCWAYSFAASAPVSCTEGMMNVCR